MSNLLYAVSKYLWILMTFGKYFPFEWEQQEFRLQSFNTSMDEWGELMDLGGDREEEMKLT